MSAAPTNSSATIETAELFINEGRQAVRLRGVSGSRGTPCPSVWSKADTAEPSQEEARHDAGPYDTLIAGQALARGLTLVTANTREFARVEGLSWQDWTQE